MTPDVVYDQLIGMRCARKLVFSWGGNPGVGSLHRLRDAVEHEWPVPLELEEHSHGDGCGVRRGRCGVPVRVRRGHEALADRWGRLDEIEGAAYEPILVPAKTDGSEHVIANLYAGRETDRFRALESLFSSWSSINGSRPTAR
jgi:acyl CoA:acetate/3-ketoacid CoA transferase alpha subunit